jgi:hypothetical protein
MNANREQPETYAELLADRERLQSLLADSEAARRGAQAALDIRPAGEA